ncbi:MAG: hypothetical protein Salg2KO_10220 [Salibacteraceae bacterium]
MANELGLDGKVICSDSSKIDISKFQYDMMYTSPPYWYKKDKRPVEQYEDMPDYDNRNEWIRNFFLPMFDKCWRGLKEGGVLCLNIPPCMYDHLPRCDEEMDLLTWSKRRTKNPDKVYIWRKPSNYGIRPSPIHGDGVFALEDLPSNQRLCDYAGLEMSLRDFKEQYGKDYRYTYKMTRIHKVICAKDLPFRHYNISNYINEHTIPNVCLKKRGLYTLRPIIAGEELVLYYGKSYPRDYDLDYTLDA